MRHSIYFIILYYFMLYIYVYAVKLKAGPIFAVFIVKAGSFLVFLLFFVFKISFSLQKEGTFEKKQQNTLLKVKN